MLPASVSEENTSPSSSS